MVFLIICLLLAVGWWLVIHRRTRRIASHVMNRWIETGTMAANATDPKQADDLLGKWDSLPDFRFEFSAQSPRPGRALHALKVTVTGTGRYLGFRGDITDDGHAVIWYEKGSPSRVRRLVEAISSRYSGIINANDFPAHAEYFKTGRRSPSMSPVPAPTSTP